MQCLLSPNEAGCDQLAAFSMNDRPFSQLALSPIDAPSTRQKNSSIQPRMRSKKNPISSLSTGFTASLGSKTANASHGQGST